MTFWLAMLAIGVSIAWTTAELSQSESPPALGRFLEKFHTDASSAVSTLEKQGLIGLKNWLSESSHTRLMNIFVLDTEGNEAYGQALPPRLQHRVQREMLGIIPNRANNMKPLFSQMVVVPDGSTYQLMALFKRPHPLLLLVTPQRLVTAFIISGLVCFALARYLASPVHRLRVATQKLSGGDLHIRVGKDIGRRRDEIGGLAKDFDHMAEQLQSLMSAQQQLLRDVSHELRSPLARLHVALGLVRQRKGKDVKTELDRIEREAERLNELIGQILSLARMDSTTDIMNSERVDLASLLEDIAQDAEFEAHSCNRHVRVIKTKPITITANAELLHSAIENVVRNALRYTPEKSTVEVSLEGASAQKGNVTISVRDYGPGVPEEALETMFKPFARVDDARQRDSGGHGIGLAIAEKAVRRHKGEITAHNTEGGGLRVDIQLPT